MDVSTYISLAALFLSSFTFYWTSVRSKNNLYLVRIQPISADFDPEFAIVNASSNDVLVTDLTCGFKAKDDSTFYPSQTIVINQVGNRLIKSGEAVHCKVKFTEPFTKTFVSAGELDTGSKPNLYLHELTVQISWVSGSGVVQEKNVSICKYGFREDGHCSFSRPLGHRFDLAAAH